MSLIESWSDCWRRWIGSCDGGRLDAIDILMHRYVREKQHAMRFSQHAERMHYPQFRERLLRIMAEEEKHVEWIATKLKALGGVPPAVIEVRPTNENSWHYLQSDLEEERRCEAELEEDKLSIGADFPDILALLERIEEECKRHREEIREMLMRSDPQSLWLA